MHDARVPQVGGKLFYTLACRVTSQSGSWKPFYMPIRHHQVLMTNLFCPASPFFLICALFLDWRSNLATGLRMIWGCHFVSDWILCQKSFEWFVTKVGTTIADYCSRESKARDNVAFQKSYHHLVIIGPTWNCFYPFWYVVNSNQYVLMAKRRGKGSHEVDTPYVKNLNH